MDRQEAAFVVVRVEQRHLLMAMHDIDGVVDIQGDGGGRMGVAGAVGSLGAVSAHFPSMTWSAASTGYDRYRADARRPA
jgi:hypothetical protein